MVKRKFPKIGSLVTVSNSNSEFQPFMYDDDYSQDKKVKKYLEQFLDLENNTCNSGILLSSAQLYKVIKIFRHVPKLSNYYSHDDCYESETFILLLGMQSKNYHFLGWNADAIKVYTPNEVWT